jgi:hypothetical protein
MTPQDMPVEASVPDWPSLDYASDDLHSVRWCPAHTWTAVAAALLILSVVFGALPRLSW